MVRVIMQSQQPAKPAMINILSVDMDITRLREGLGGSGRGLGFGEGCVVRVGVVRFWEGCVVQGGPWGSGRAVGFG